MTKFSGITASGADVATTGRLVGTDLAGPTDYLYTLTQMFGAAVAQNLTKTVMLATATIYINPTTGSDSNTGTQAAPFKTFAAAYAYACTAKNLNNQTLQFQFVGTAFTEEILVDEAWPSGSGTIILDFAGGTLHTSGPSIKWKGARYGLVTVQNVDVASSGDTAIVAQDSIFLTIGAGVRFGTCAQAHINALDYALPLVFNDIEIYGGAQWHLVAEEAATYAFYFPPVVTLTGTPNFSFAYAYALRGGFIFAGGTTFNGSATGTRFFVEGPGTINTGNSGLSFFPGSVAGSGCNFGTYDFTTFADDTAAKGGGPFLTNAVNDAAAQAAGVPIGGVYRNGSVLQFRVS